MVITHKTTACSHAEIAGIDCNRNYPEITVKDVVKEAFKKCHYGHSPDGNLFNVYIFSCAIYPKGSGYVEGVSGDILAKFIRDNHLGEVLESTAQTNIKYHKDHANKVYMWCVDHKGVGAWYKEQVVNKEAKDWFKMADEDFSDEVDDDVDYDDDDDWVDDDADNDDEDDDGIDACDNPF